MDRTISLGRQPVVDFDFDPFAPLPEAEPADVIDRREWVSLMNSRYSLVGPPLAATDLRFQ